jgi:hypothetical protein
MLDRGEAFLAHDLQDAGLSLGDDLEHEDPDCHKTLSFEH